ncbi:MAG: RimK family alpha-L-glutamate ligase [Lachnospiraceae bacterium]|nr:RimK family alpha-L-glutamate ligase [Lachnospiraceae bacterium]
MSLSRPRGIHVVNSFFDGYEKHEELCRMLMRGAAEAGCHLERVTGGELWSELFKSGYRLSDIRPEIDFVLFWDKDVTLAGELERQGLPVFNSSAAIRVCDNKAETFLALKEAGIPMPETIIAPKRFRPGTDLDVHLLDTAEKELGFPMIVKECYGSFGAQVYLAGNREELNSLVIRIGKRPWLLQRFVRSSEGRDVRVQMVGERAAAAMLRSNKNDFRANITNGGKMEAFEVPPEWEKLSAHVMSLLGLDFAGIDYLFGEDGEPLLCEVNSNAYIKNLFDCTGIDVSVEIFRYILGRISK